MKFFLIALASALGFVGVHIIVGWVTYNLPLLAIVLIMTGFVWFIVALLNDLGVITVDLSKVLERASR